VSRVEMDRFSLMDKQNAVLPPLEPLLVALSDSLMRSRALCLSLPVPLLTALEPVSLLGVAPARA
jgi:hypothetical protein